MIPVNHLCVLGRLSWFPLACPSKTGLRAGLPGLGRRSHPHSDIVSIPIIHNVVRHLQALQPQCIGLPKQGVLWGSSQLPASCPYMCKWPRVLGAGVAGRPWPFCPCGTGSTHPNNVVVPGCVFIVILTFRLLKFRLVNGLVWASKARGASGAPTDPPGLR